MSKQPMGEDDYLLGTGAEELERLGFQHEVWADLASRAWRVAGFRRGQTLLDLGCGPGYAARELARIAGPAGRVLAIDGSERFLARVSDGVVPGSAAPIETRCADLETLDLGEAVADGAVLRWVLSFLRDPGGVVRRAARALRPGGTLAVLDYASWWSLSLEPHCEAFDRIKPAIRASHEETGADLDVGGHVPGMMRRAGLRIRDVHVEVRAARPGTLLWEWPSTYFASFLPRLVRRGLLSADDHAAFRREWERRSDDPDSFFLTPPIICVVGERTTD